jgi:hypothetical protein
MPNRVNVDSELDELCGDFSLLLRCGSEFSLRFMAEVAVLVMIHRLQLLPYHLTSVRMPPFLRLVSTIGGTKQCHCDHRLESRLMGK